MKNTKLTYETLLFGLAFLLALGLRLLHLGHETLSDGEAELALQALALARGGVSTISSQPGYVLWTSALFFITGAGNLAARLLPALAGSVLVLAPRLFRPQLGRTAAILLAFFLAIDPSLVAASRQAGGLMLAVTFGVLAAGYLLSGKPQWAGICAGLALLGGASLWAGLLALGLSLAWTTALRRRKHTGTVETNALDSEAERLPTPIPWQPALPWLAGALVFGGSLFFIFPTGLSAAVSSLPEYLQGWGRVPTAWVGTSGIPVMILLGALLFYAPFAIFAGVWGAVTGGMQRRSVDVFLTRWVIVVLLVALFHPSRQPTDLVWVMIPIWALAARQIARLFPMFGTAGASALGQAAVVLVLIVFAWLNFVALSRSPFSQSDAQIYLVSLAGSLVFIAIITILASGGWSSSLAVSGLTWGVGAALLLFTLSGSWNAAGLGRNPWAELWRMCPRSGHTSSYVQDADLLTSTVGGISEWNSRSRSAIDVTVLNVESPALEWALRDHRQVHFTNVIPPGEKLSLIITEDQEMPSLAAAYTGQDFVWQRSIAWHLLQPPDWSRWVIVREAASTRADLILWVRSDLFPGASPAELPELSE